MLLPVPLQYARDLLSFKGSLFYEVGKNYPIDGPKRVYSGKSVRVLGRDFSGAWIVSLKEDPTILFCAELEQLKCDLNKTLEEFL